MASKPVAIPEIFNGEGGQTWSDCLDHFDSVAVVNGWVRARLTGRAATVMRRLSEADKASFDTICAAMKNRFEPQCRKGVFIAEFQTKTRRRGEDWVSFGEDLKALVEKAYPSRQPEAQELLALNQFLNQIEEQQLAFAVRQRSPATVDAAVAAVLELETYLRRPRIVLPVKEDRDGGSAVAAVSRQPPREDLMEKIVERLDKLEARINPTDAGQRKNRERRMPANITYWSCREEGHLQELPEEK